MEVAEQSLLLILLLRIGFMAALASLVVAVRPLRAVVRGKETSPFWRLARIGLEIFVLAAGVWTRMSFPSPAADLSLEGCFLLGWIHGSTVGVAAGLILGIIDVWGGHWAPLAFLPLVGLGAGQLVIRYPEVAGWIAGARVGGREVARETGITMLILLILMILWIVMGIFNAVPPIFPIDDFFTFAGILISSAISVVTPLYIWRGLRMESELEMRTRQMEKERMESLMERFRPHFLFNTLGAIVSLMRTDVEGARDMTLKLAGLLRRSMSEGEGFVPLKEELRFVRDYLDIEAIRHGPRLRVKEVIEDAVLEVPVPRMVLQPLVENSILHGIGPKVEGGTVKIKACKSGEFLRITVSDDGVGIEGPLNEGIGVGNLKARLDTAYGPNAARLEIEGGPEMGASAVLWVPLERSTR